VELEDIPMIIRAVKQESKKEIALKLLAKGLPVSEVSEVRSLSEYEVTELEEDLEDA